MDLQARKIEFVQEFLKIQSEDILVRLENLLKKETSKDHNQDVKPFTVEEFNDRINRSMLDSKHSKLTDNEEIIAEMHKWR